MISNVNAVFECVDRDICGASEVNASVSVVTSDKDDLLHKYWYNYKLDAPKLYRLRRHLRPAFRHTLATKAHFHGQNFIDVAGVRIDEALMTRKRYGLGTTARKNERAHADNISIRLCHAHIEIQG